MNDSEIWKIARAGLETAIAECSEHAGQSSTLALELLDESLETLRDLLPSKPRLLGQTLGAYVAESVDKPDALEKLRQYGANMDYRDDRGYTPLQKAVIDNNEDRARNLVGAGADIDANCLLNGKSSTTVHLAVVRDRPKMIDLLLELGANADRANPSDGETPLGHAVARKTLSGSPSDRSKFADMTQILVKALIGGGADPLEECNDAGHVPLLSSVHSGENEDVSIYLAQRAQYNQDELDLCFVEAIRKDWLRLISALVDVGANPRTATGDLDVLDIHKNAQSATVELVNALLTERAVQDSLAATPEASPAAETRKLDLSPL